MLTVIWDENFLILEYFQLDLHVVRLFWLIRAKRQKPSKIWWRSSKATSIANKQQTVLRCRMHGIVLVFVLFVMFRFKDWLEVLQMHQTNLKSTSLLLLFPIVQLMLDTQTNSYIQPHQFFWSLCWVAVLCMCNASIWYMTMTVVWNWSTYAISDTFYWYWHLAYPKDSTTMSMGINFFIERFVAVFFCKVRCETVTSHRETIFSLVWFTHEFD